MKLSFAGLGMLLACALVGCTNPPLPPLPAEYRTAVQAALRARDLDPDILRVDLAPPRLMRTKPAGDFPPLVWAQPVRVRARPGQPEFPERNFIALLDWSPVQLVDPSDVVDRSRLETPRGRMTAHAHENH